jgi:hypothetical protein
VLALDARVGLEVGILRRLMLKALHVREFSAAAEFKELAASFPLHDVICGCVARRSTRASLSREHM